MSVKIKTALENQKDIYLVGGALRDFLLKRKIKDLDFAVKCEKQELFIQAQKISQKLKSKLFALDEERGNWRITLENGLNIDLSVLNENIINDLKSRDFTINSMGISLKDISQISKKSNKKESLFVLKIKDKKKILDPLNGQKDLQKKIIRLTSAMAIKEDPLRILRAFRFACVLGFSIEKKTMRVLKAKKKLISSCAKERIKEELLGIFSSRNSSEYIKSMSKERILFEIFPKLKAQENCAKIYYGKGGVLKHTLNVIRRLDMFFEKPASYIAAFNKFNLHEKQKKLLKLSALLHDIAKPDTAKKINGRLRFFGHEELGAKYTYEAMKDLKFSNESIKFATKIIGQHLRIGNIAHSEIISEKTMFKIFSDLGNYTAGLLILSWADHASYISEEKLKQSLGEMRKKPFKIPQKGLPKTGFKKTLRFIQVVNNIASKYASKKKDFDVEPLLNGNEIMAILSLKPGPTVGEIIKRLKFIQFQGKVKTKKEAESYIKTLRI